MATPDSESFVRTFARGLRVIEVMGQGLSRKNIAEISELAELPRTVVRRLLLTLADLGFVRTDSRLYWLTPKVLRLGLTYLYTLPFWQQSQLVLEELGTRIGQSCAISVLDGSEIVYVQRFHTRRILAMSPSTGTRLPAHVVSMGRVLLGGLDHLSLKRTLDELPRTRYTSKTITQTRDLRNAIQLAREQGYAWVDGELDESICGLAVPVREQDGSVVAALNVSLISGQYSEETAVAKYLPLLRLATSRLRSAG
ncbi:MAG: IclR family transcriptional regulator domain-containing protein [Burkholderiaceae bacterium]|jgi:IclR family pca regulon transcriptional regulator